MWLVRKFKGHNFEALENCVWKKNTTQKWWRSSLISCYVNPDSLRFVLTNLTEAIKCYNGYISVYNEFTGEWVSYNMKTQQAKSYWFSSSFQWIRFSLMTDQWKTEVSFQSLKKPAESSGPELWPFLQTASHSAPCTCQSWLPGAENSICSWVQCDLWSHFPGDYFSAGYPGLLVATVSFVAFEILNHTFYLVLEAKL